MEVSDSEELLGMEQGYIEGRMDMESTDYPGTGANNHHDPKTPGRAWLIKRVSTSQIFC